VESEKIYNDDSEVPYKSTELGPRQSKMEIEGLLAKYGIKDTAWRWDPENNEVFVGFSLLENINRENVCSYVKVQAPLIWKRAKKSQREEVDWRISLRVMFWFIKSTLEVSFLWRIHKTVAFLPFLRNAKDEPMATMILSRIEQIQFMELPALPSAKTQRINITSKPGEIPP